MHIRALSVDIDASGSFLGSLKGLAIAISLCDSEKHVIFLCFAILTMLWCFQGWVWLTKVVPSILRVQWVHIRALSGDIDASGSFLGSLKGLAIAISLCDSETT